MKNASTHFEATDLAAPVIETVAGYPIVRPEILEAIQEADPKKSDLINKITPQEIAIHEADGGILDNPDVKNVFRKILEMTKNARLNTFLPFTQQQYISNGVRAKGSDMAQKDMKIIEALADGSSADDDLQIEGGYLHKRGNDSKGYQYGFTNKFIQALEGGIFDAAKVKNTLVYQHFSGETQTIREQQLRTCTSVLESLVMALKTNPPSVDSTKQLSTRQLEEVIHRETKGALEFSMEISGAQLKGTPSLYPLLDQYNFAEGFNQIIKAKDPDKFYAAWRIDTKTVKELLHWLSDGGPLQVKKESNE